MLIGKPIWAQTQEWSPLLSFLLPPDTAEERHLLHCQAACPRPLRNGYCFWQSYRLAFLSNEPRFSYGDYRPPGCAVVSAFFSQRYARGHGARAERGAPPFLSHLQCSQSCSSDSSINLSHFCPGFTYSSSSDGLKPNCLSVGGGGQAAGQEVMIFSCLWKHSVVLYLLV